MPRANHIIRHLIWEVESPRVTDALQLQDKLAEINETSFLPRLSELLDSLIAPGKEVYVPELTIQLELDRSDLDTDFIKTVLEAFSQEIVKSISMEKNMDITTDESGWNPQTERSATPGAYRTYDQPPGPWQAFEFFLRSGIIPWWKDSSLQKLENQVLHFLQTHPDDRTVLSGDLQYDQNLLYRFRNQISRSFIAECTKISGRSFPDSDFLNLELFLNNLAMELEGSAGSEIITRLQIARWILSRHPGYGIGGHHKRFLEISLLFIIQGFRESSIKKIPEIITLPETKTEIPRGLNVVVKAILDKIRDHPNSSEKPKSYQGILGNMNADALPQDESGPAFSQNGRKPGERPPGNQMQVEDPVKELMKEGIFAEHAGLIILHPFLPAFFIELGLLDAGKKFKSEPARQRAVHILYYLACGKKYPPEDRLIVQKILCGKPLDETMVRTMKIRESEFAKCGELLESVLSHWGALKNTGPKALQGTFLQRAGKLTRRPDHWEITVEQKPVDILLTKLPWGLTPVYLPWNPYPVHVTWI